MFGKLRDYLTTRLILFSGDPTLTRQGQFTVKSNGKAYVYYSGAEQELGAGGGGGAPTTAQYLTLALDGTLSAERRFVPTLPLSAADGGANGDYTLSLSGWSSTTDGDMLYRNGTAVGTKTASQVRSFLSLVVGTNVQAWDADLDGVAALGNGLPVRSGGSWTTATISSPLSLSGSTLSVDLSGYQPLDAGLTSLTAADGTAGLPYVGSANSWSTATYSGMLSVVSGAWKVVGLRESGGQDLTMGAVADGAVLRRSGTTVAGSTAATIVSDAAGADGLVVRTSAGAVGARSVTSSDSSLVITNPTGSGGNIDIVVASGLKTIPVYSGFTILLPQGVSLNVDGAGSLTAAGVYGTNVSEADFKCTQLGDGASALCRWYVDAKTRTNEGTIGIDVVFKLGSDISGSTQHYNIGLSSNLSMSSADPTGHRVTISFASGGTNWLLSTKDGTTETDTDTSVAVTASYYYVVRFEITSTSSQVKIGRGSTISAAKSSYDGAGWTVSSSTLPTSTTDLYQLISVYRLAGSINRAILLNYYRCTVQPSWA